jgi:hypothetical protein
MPLVCAQYRKLRSVFDLCAKKVARLAVVHEFKRKRYRLLLQFFDQQLRDSLDAQRNSDVAHVRGQPAQFRVVNLYRQDVFVAHLFWGLGLSISQLMNGPLTRLVFHQDEYHAEFSSLPTNLVQEGREILAPQMFGIEAALGLTITALQATRSRMLGVLKRGFCHDTLALDMADFGFFGAVDVNRYKIPAIHPLIDDIGHPCSPRRSPTPVSRDRKR